jgi:signal transduction histidine kinase
VDSHAAKIIFDVAAKKEKGEKIDQFGMINKLVSTLSAGTDINNVAVLLYDVLKGYYPIDVLVLLIKGEIQHELMIVSDSVLDDRFVSRIILTMKKRTNVGEVMDFNRKKFNTIATSMSRKGAPLPRLNNVMGFPLSVAGNINGYLMISSASCFDLTDDDIAVMGVFAHTLSMFADYEKIRRRIADSKIRLESMLGSMGEGVMAVNAKQELTLINRAARELLSINKAGYFRPLWESINDRRIFDLLKELSETGTEGSTIKKEITIEQSGVPRVINFKVNPTLDIAGNIAGWIFLLSDITKEKEVDRMKSEFISTTSHELRTPLTAIKESITLIRDGTAGAISKEQSRFVEIAARNIDRLAQLISDLLDISRIETGKLHLTKSLVRIESLFEQARSTMELIAKNAKVAISFRMDCEIPEVMCDPDRIIQVLVNLLSNAVKFTPGGGTVTISASVVDGAKLRRLKVSLEKIAASERYVLVSVKDTGIGISASDVPKLFRRFGQVDGSLTRKVGGTGLGLSICKELVEMHGGIIWVKSSERKGSAFNFILPV